MSLLKACGSEEKLYSDDVFSAYTYTGNGSTQTINNGIDLAGKGGLVWVKCRNSAGVPHRLLDTARGGSYSLRSNTTNAQDNGYPTISFNSNGWSVVNDINNEINYLNDTYVSWTFRKAPKFFDVVTYTGDGTSNRAIAHALGTTVGMVITKITSTTGGWNTYHRSATGDLVLNTTAAQTGSHAIVTEADSSTFTVTGVANTNGATYVAYLFAHDTSTDGIIQCGSFTTDGSGNATVNLGWEPQYVLLKSATAATNWNILDTSRGWNMSASDERLKANISDVADTAEWGNPSSTGFAIGDIGFVAGSTVIYLAIRRPNKPPTTGTQVYNTVLWTGNQANNRQITGVGFSPDYVEAGTRSTANTFSRVVVDRLRGASPHLMTTHTNSEQLNSDLKSFDNDGITIDYVSSGAFNNNSDIYGRFFKRAPGVFDIVCYTGTGSATTVAHSLGVAPEMVINKRRSNTSDWNVSYGNFTKSMYLNTTDSDSVLGASYVTSPTATTFAMSNNAFNVSGSTYVAYLFATKAGISKCGSYTGNGSSQTIDCGFTTGSRFIMIKRTDSTGDWKVIDSTRGISSSSDPTLALNSTAAEVTGTDCIDPDSSGFIVNQESTNNLNVNTATYIYLAYA